MNYIRHLTAFFSKVYEDDGLQATHVSLYMALFQIWNISRFKNPISINRSETMRLAKIGSKTTYHKCLKKLHELGYIKYQPSRNPLKGSLVHMARIGTSSGTSLEPLSGHVVVPSINNTNNKLNINKDEIIQFFISKGFKKSIAEAFLNYNEARGWLISGMPMKNWKSAAELWMSKKSNYNKNEKIEKQELKKDTYEKL